MPYMVLKKDMNHTTKHVHKREHDTAAKGDQHTVTSKRWRRERTCRFTTVVIIAYMVLKKDMNHTTKHKHKREQDTATNGHMQNMEFGKDLFVHRLCPH